MPSVDRALLLAGVIVLAGLALAATVDRNFGGVVVLAGWVAFVFSLHRFGRSGVDRGAR